MAKDSKLTMRYKPLRLYLNGLIVGCLLVTIIASLLAGTDATEIVKRGLIVVGGLVFVSMMLIRFWGLWQQLNSAESKSRK
jgi:hypothetical protein